MLIHPPKKFSSISIGIPFHVMKNYHANIQRPHEHARKKKMVVVIASTATRLKRGRKLVLHDVFLIVVVLKLLYCTGHRLLFSWHSDSLL